jgi:molybdenum cofactor synthesis domain-containing protein
MSSDGRYNAAVITVSDRCFRKEQTDSSGPALTDALIKAGINVSVHEVVPDERSTIASVLQKYAVHSDVHLILTTGGTGFSVRDVTPEATRDVIERPAHGIAELLRYRGADQTALSWISRGEAGIAGTKLIINLPGNPAAMEPSVQALKPILFHALDLLNGKTGH